MSARVLAFIGGSGVYAADAISEAERLDIVTPWGRPSDEIIRGRMNGVRVLFLARHGRGHKIPPGEINYRANIDALKRAGATDIISISSCGSLREDLPPGAFVIVDQFVDRTTTREKTFFGPGFVAHVSMADPVCPALKDALAESAAALELPHAVGGTYVCIDGPQFSSRAESEIYRSWKCDVIGMTNMPEAKLAREAELPYATLAMVTDYDCWRAGEKAVEVTDVLAVMRSNAANAQKMIGELCTRLGPHRTPSPLGIETVLDHAVITAPEAQSAEMRQRLDVVARRFLRK
ncbi:MAG TPA: S-methyl-5'-thioadenosine phosphorylase [Amphiplicatus sp.]|nr:S-methyl-5'-thioadenosine phosphorylase [Caulobacterales bacterium]HOP21106.1 S-methyl-5'-thioadenosine phosphorylase [Amphiplicatus sp.]HRX40642.1 S-methyl-5'-thioadenosine phosphorylase [Parvularculaceae bacterium]